ncbi:MAG TPA: hypothetical protein VGE39_04635 [Prosthecobacter sp.]
MSEPPPPAPPPAPTGLCSRCGKPDVAKFGDEFICDDCYTACGSCCAEWFQKEE